jgi:PAS domain S-box-containing protein
VKRFLGLIFVSFSLSQAISQDLKVGVFQNPPLIYQDENEVVKGLFIELLEKVAKEEGWELEYVFSSFDSLLYQLERGEIDLLPDVAKDPRRDSIYIFNQGTVLPTWGQVFSTDKDVQSFFDLEGRKIAYVEGSYYINDPTQGLKTLLQNFEVEAEFIPMANINEVLTALDSDEMELAVLNRINGNYYIRIQSPLIDFDKIIATPILFAPADLCYAFHRDYNRLGPYINKVNAYLEEQQKNRSSFYYEKLELYILNPDEYTLPEWIGIIFLVLIVIFGLLATLNTVLQRRVKLRTRQLDIVNSELRQNEQKLKLAIDSSNEGVFEWNIQEDKLTIDENLSDLVGVGKIGISEDLETFRKAVYKDDLGLFRRSFNEYLERGGKSYHQVDFRMQSSSGEPRWFSVRGKITDWEEDKPIRYLGTMQDIEERKKAERVREILLSELKERNKELKCLYKTSQFISDPVLSMSDVFRRTVDILPESWQYPSYTCARITYGKKTYQTKDYHETEWSQRAEIMVSGKSRGIIEVNYTKEMPEAAEGPFLTEERNLINLLAQMLGDMIERHKMDEAIELKETQERERISKELHDGVQQTLTVASINLNQVHTKLEKIDANTDLKKNVQTGLEKVTEAIKEVRTIAHELDIEYVASVENLLKELNAVSDTNFNFYTNLKQEGLDSVIERTLFRITQEAINNILKHAHAGNATIQLMKYPELVILTVEDDGVGFDFDKVKESFGLNGIRNRSSLVNGSCSIDSSPGKGTSITIEVPLEKNEF